MLHGAHVALVPAPGACEVIVSRHNVGVTTSAMRKTVLPGVAAVNDNAAAAFLQSIVVAMMPVLAGGLHGGGGGKGGGTMLVLTANETEVTFATPSSSKTTNVFGLLALAGFKMSNGIG